MKSVIFRLSLIFVAGAVWACESTSPPPDGTGGAGGGGGSSPDPHADDLLFDDFEDGNETTAVGSPWYSFTDDTNGGASELSGREGASSWVGAPGYESSHALAVDFAMTKGDYEWDPYVAIAAGVPGTVQVSDYQGISYTYRGAAHSLRVETSNVTDYDFFLQAIPASASWTTVVIPFEKLRQAGFGTPVGFDAELVAALTWIVNGKDGQTGSLEVDDIYFDKEVVIDKGPPDLVVRAPEPPALEELESIEIPGVLQLKVMEQLDRGYNITNWLEQGRFASFEYDESFVEDVAAAGFRALRLPIDLDLYVTERSGSGDELELTLHEDLFTILDNFDEWTRASGLSFTIDYHQYDGSLDLRDPESVDEVVALWRLVARHFAASDRDDLYYELMNEPELSSGASGVLPAAPWTAAAERIIEAIREEDADRTIIFGDVNWYGIEELTERTPFEDDNVVYAFHFYDPFIFTHQGANWTDMGSTHDLPYPYAPERWSEYSSDLGLASGSPAWILSQFRNYYRDGSREALWNRVAQAKRWAVEHGVPVICNEFGVHDRTSRLEDRVRYYTDLIGIFAELEIPWQHWFMILQPDGTVIPEYREAFRLD